MQTTIALPNLEATRELGRRIGKIVQAETIIALCGQMGSGKTTLVQAIAEGLQVEEFVVSPTFVMINEYHSGRLPLYHLDLYRFVDQPQFNASTENQLEEILQTKGVVIIEWAQVLFDHFNNNLDRLCVNGYLKMDLVTEMNNDQARLLTLTTINKNDLSVAQSDNVSELSKFFSN